MTEVGPPSPERPSTQDQRPETGPNVTTPAESTRQQSLAEQYDQQLEAFYREMGAAIALLATLRLPARLAPQPSAIASKLASTGDLEPGPAELVEISASLGNVIASVEFADLDDPEIAEGLVLVRNRYGAVNQLLSDLQITRIHQQAEHRRLSKENAQKSERKLEGYFAEAYRSERRGAALLRAVAFFLLFLTAGLAVWVATSIDRLNWQSEVAHLAISLPLLGGAYFASFEARDHRRYARNERGWQARIDSFDDFCSPLPENLRNDVRTTFAKHLYADPPDLGSAASLADANQKVLDQALAIIRVVRSGETAGT